MTRIASSLIVILALVLAFFGGRAISAPDKYTVQVPGGLAFFEFRGYEDWRVIAISENLGLIAVIIGNPVMIDAYKKGVPGNGEPFPGRLQDGQNPLEPEKARDVSRPADGAGYPARRRFHGEGQQEVRGPLHRGLQSAAGTRR